VKLKSPPGKGTADPQAVAKHFHETSVETADPSAALGMTKERATIPWTVVADRSVKGRRPTYEDENVSVQ
jgi:hypothetical protein